MASVVLVLAVLLVVLVFTYTNGFHDAANAIATVVSTRALPARQAVLLAAVLNFAGALSGDAVAKTIGAGLVDTTYITVLTILCAMVGGITWNLVTWRYGLPSSSSHALIGGLIGAAFASAHGRWSVIRWSYAATDPHTGKTVIDGIYPKVVLPMISSPIIGFVGAFLLMGLLLLLVRQWRARTVNLVFGKLQLASASYMAWAHGFADGQKTMGVMALALYAATKAGDLNRAPSWLWFLRTPHFEISTWVKVSCGLAMCFGTYTGGWRIIATLGHKLVRIKPIHGFAAEATGATILLVAGRLGMPISTTHCITTAVMGVGSARRFNAVNWTLVEKIIWGWVLTIPATALLAYGLVRLAQFAGWAG